MANKQKGEITVQFGAKKYVLRPTFEAIAELEDFLGESILSFAPKIQQKTGLKVTTAVIHAGLVGAGEKFTFEEVGQLVLAEGVMKFGSPVGYFIAQVLSGVKPVEPSDDEKKTPAQAKP